jgi:sugar O-acyltransferase (sialic acid O-acetyltransferase NeuD family)
LIEDLDRAGVALEFAGFVVSDLEKLTDTDSREEVLGDYSWLSDNRKAIDAVAVGIGSPAVRLRVGREIGREFPDLRFPPLIHPTVIMDRESATVEDGVLVCAGTIGTVNVVLREFSMVNLACTLGHESEVGAGSVLNPTVNVSGGVKIGEQVLVGTGSQILQYVHVGDRATVGAGALVNKHVDAGSTVVGVPARPLTRS